MEQEEKQVKIGFFKKWYTYQKERFPVVVFLFYTLCIVIGTLILTSFCLGYGSMDFIHNIITDEQKKIFIDNPEFIIDSKILIRMIIMLVCGFLQFLMVRIVDEFKDYEEDCKYRPYRPVPRGLISLTELKGLFAICFITQILLTYFFGGDFFALALLWVIFFLMTKSFFIKKILDKHLILEVILDELMMPAMIIYLSSFLFEYDKVWNLLLNQYVHDGGYYMRHINDIEFASKVQFMFIAFLLLSYFCSCIAEVARKIRSKDKEENGVKTYTAVFGIPKATLLLSVLEICAFACQYVILGEMRNIILFVALAIPLFSNIMFNIKPIYKASKMVELSGNLYIAFSYLSMAMLYSGFKFII